MDNPAGHRYAIRHAIGGPPVLIATVDRRHRLLTMTTGDGRSLTVDALLARAIWMTIQSAVYEGRSLRADGPRLTLECDAGTGWKAPR